MFTLIKKAFWGAASAWALRKGKDWWANRNRAATTGTGYR